MKTKPSPVAVLIDLSAGDDELDEAGARATREHLSLASAIIGRQLRSEQDRLAHIDMRLAELRGF